MSWYLAKIVFRIICGQGNHTAQFDEQLRLISAMDEEEALKKAWAIGNNEQETFYNQKRQLVQWKFIDVAALYPLTELIDGAELYSRINEVDDAEEFIAIIHQQARSVKDQYLTTCEPLIR